MVVGVGGYASGPILEMAYRKGIPTLIQEQNSYAGVTNRLLARKVNRICVAYDKMERYFPAEKILITGNPVREDLKKLTIDREQALDYYGLRADLKTIFVFGGSLGAKSINEALDNGREIIERHKDKIQVLWQAGKLYISKFQQCDTATLPNVHIRPFIDRMDLAYSIADVVVCRAGALTIAELSTLGKAAVLVPSPNVAEDHQTKNAMSLVEKNAALLVKDGEAPLKMLKTAIDLADNDLLKKELSTNIKRLAKPDAAENIAQAVIELANTER